MAAQLRFRLISPALLQTGPAAVRISPSGLLVVGVDETQVAPELIPPMEEIANEILLRGRQLADDPGHISDPPFTFRINLVPSLGGRLVTASWDGQHMESCVRADAMSPELARCLEAAGTASMSHLTVEPP